ncbi:AAA family ATPase [Cellulosimicrobium sp. CUA-896]|uniref:AAA family ATPase n=1 Tax=Cellulosimicrobium sp. CUA-896 TaxID=1517881 RepID=UPI0021013938|nr:AAA family ATPase [Cellulosimicrobium sp. CUA-896]
MARRLHAARVVSATDLRVALRLGRLTGEQDERVLLAAALAVRAVRSGSVCVRLDDLGALRLPEDEEAARAETEHLPWPGAEEWAEAVARSPLVAAGVDSPDDRPTRWVGGMLYLDRYWRDELVVRRDVDGRLAAHDLPADDARLTAALSRLFPAEQDARQRLAAAHAAHRRLTVLTGGPGTGKTTTVARLLAVLHDAAAPADGSRLRVALAAPTGKAAARLQEAVRDVVSGFEPDDRDRVGVPVASTLHRLLGHRAGSRTRFRHDAHHHLPHDVVVVDETSMVALPLMARLLEALRPAPGSCSWATRTSSRPSRRAPCWATSCTVPRSTPRRRRRRSRPRRSPPSPTPRRPSRARWTTAPRWATASSASAPSTGRAATRRSCRWQRRSATATRRRSWRCCARATRRSSSSRRPTTSRTRRRSRPSARTRWPPGSDSWPRRARATPPAP